MSFNENSYTVAESDGQVSVSLRIDGRFFVPVWAIVEIREGTATGRLCMLLGMNLYEHRLLTELLRSYCMCICVRMNLKCALIYYLPMCLQTLKTTPVQDATM